MARKGENIYKRKDGRWEGRYIKGRRADGSIYYGYIYANNYKEVKKKLVIKKASIFSNTNTTERFYGTVNNWLDYWLESVAVFNVKPSTFDSYKSKIDCHIRPALGDIHLSELTSTKIENFINSTKEKISINSLHAVFRVLKTALKYAEKLNFVQRSLYENIQLPKVKKPKIVTITRTEHKRLVKEAKKSPEGLSVLLSLETGMRIGEISGLKWKDIDFENQTISVQRTLQRVGTLSEGKFRTHIIEEKPKSETSERIIPLSTALVKRLQRAKNQSKSVYVISKGEKFVEPRTIRYQFKRLLESLKLPKCSFHALRHSFATRCLEKGVNIAVISSLMGHASTKMTLDIYTNSNLNEERLAVESVTCV
ncbi:tyrosine-type recombinase/integrase [Enterococcus wangshanyuanii]|uniref:Site-specific integrase n=1 Tax=Enterococcus wangshanyuanii TaxID=2005703 RepID=A0ABQ1P3N9_9ENTE|nr:site-specific integrase [Enterococcus wangshanyuanii]GGC89761.1 site-specific integrase [Enterococcus wangshanyuanii]